MLFTSFERIIILDWYDKIINGFIEMDNRFYYCNLLFEGVSKYDCIYVCISMDFFVNRVKISQIVESNSFRENEEKLYDLFNHIKKDNKSYLIKTEDLKFGPREIVKFKDNFNWNIGIFYLDYPDVLDKASKIDNWSQYFEKGTNLQSESQL